MGSVGLTRPHRTESRYPYLHHRRRELAEESALPAKVRGLNAAAIVQILKPQILRSQDPKSQALTPRGAVNRAPGNAAAIGLRLRRLRTKRGKSLAEVAAAAEISVGFLSALERSQMSASVGTLRRLARYYRTNILDFFDATEVNTRLVRPPKRKVLEAGPGVRMELLAGATRSWSRTCFASRPRPAAEFLRHEGEEFLFVLRGELKISLASEEYHLKRATVFT